MAQYRYLINEDGTRYGRTYLEQTLTPNLLETLQAVARDRQIYDQICFTSDPTPSPYGGEEWREIDYYDLRWIVNEKHRMERYTDMREQGNW